MVKPGDVVKLKPGTIECRADGVKPTTTATVLAKYGEGCCQLNSPLGGCRYWNEIELEKVH